MGRRYDMPTIDWGEFERMCEIQATQEEICHVFGVKETWLKKQVMEHYGQNFETMHKKFSAGGKISIRRSQFRLKDKSPAMAIFLGKVYCDQKETGTETEAMQIQVVGDVSINGNLATNEMEKKDE